MLGDVERLAFDRLVVDLLVEARLGDVVRGAARYRELLLVEGRGAARGVGLGVERVDGRLGAVCRTCGAGRLGAGRVTRGAGRRGAGRVTLGAGRLGAGRVTLGAGRLGAGLVVRGAGRDGCGVARGAGRLGAGREVDGRELGRDEDRPRWALSGRLISSPSRASRMGRRVVMLVRWEVAPNP